MPEPPTECQVDTENWYRPKYRPLGLTAFGLPPDSHWASAAQFRPPELPLGAGCGDDRGAGEGAGVGAGRAFVPTLTTCLTGFLSDWAKSVRLITHLLSFLTSS